MSSIVKQLVGQERQRRSAPESSKVAALRNLLSPKQLAFIDHPSDSKLIRAGRRSGKTYAMAVYMIILCLLVPNTPCLFLGLTRDSAMRNVWKTLITILNVLGIAHDPVQSKGSIHFPNGSEIVIFGADASDAMSRLRGSFWKLIVADEMAFVRDTSADDLIETLIPSLADLNGTLCMVSSPGPILDGLFYHCDVGKKKDDWYQMSWDMRSNPFFQKAANDPTKYKDRAHEVLAEMARKKFNGDQTNPAFRREFLGEWATDDTNLVYPYKDSNVITVLPPQHGIQHSIGMDLGSTSASAIVVIRHSDYSRRVEVVETFKQANLLVDELAAQLIQRINKYRPTFIVADTGGLGKSPVEEFRRRYLLPVLSADKTEKSFFQSVVSSDLYSKYIQVLTPQSDDLLSEWRKITKGPDGQELKGQDNHLSDAFLYAYRKLYSVHLKDYEPTPSDEERMIAQMEARLLQEDQEALEDIEDMW